MLYSLHEWNQMMLAPWRQAASMQAQWLRSPLNPGRDWLACKISAASLQLFEETTRHFPRPKWEIDHITLGDVEVPVVIEPVCEKTFGRLIHFQRDEKALRAARGGKASADPRVIIAAPMSGHYATLLRKTVLALLPNHEVFITEWADAKEVPLQSGRFDLNDFTDYMIDYLEAVGPKAHMLAVCQPGPAVLAAIAYMSKHDSPYLPATMTYMGSPIDARKSPTVTNRLAEKQPFEWFAQNMIYTVPAPHRGVLRRVYPGWLQLMSFMSMNPERHIESHWDYLKFLVEGEDAKAKRHRKFYDEYFAVCDMTEEFYLQTIRDVFQEYRLPLGEFVHRDEKIDLAAIRHVALMTVEGELDDISGIGQTQAAHDLCVNIPKDMRLDYVQKGAGHYGVFSGSKWREQICPKYARFIRRFFKESEERKLKQQSAGFQVIEGDRRSA